MVHRRLTSQDIIEEALRVLCVIIALIVLLGVKLLLGVLGWPHRYTADVLRMSGFWAHVLVVTE